MAVDVLDNLYLVITALITIAYQLIGFSIAFTFKFDKLTGSYWDKQRYPKQIDDKADFWGGSNFVLLSVITLSLSQNPDARQIIASLMLMIWSARLAGFLLFRILKTGQDDRFNDIRNKFFSFLGFWVAQMFWVWLVSLPVTIINSPAANSYRTGNPQNSSMNALDGLGIAMWAVGFSIEVISDFQKYKFRSDETNKGRTCNVGLFSWSRHPNYFGEILLQFGIFSTCVSPAAYNVIPSSSSPGIALYCSMLGPVVLTGLLLFMSGMNLQERPGAKKKYEADGPDGEKWYQHKYYLDTTSILIPMPPYLWTKIPKILKRTLFFEFSMYVFDPEKHADHKKVQDRQAEEARSSQDRLT